MNFGFNLFDEKRKGSEWSRVRGGIHLRRPMESEAEVGVE